MTRAEIIAALRQQPKSFVANTSSGIVEPDSYAQAASARGLGNWMQAKLARLSTRGRQIVMENRGHDIASRDPDVVIAAIRDVVREAGGAGARD